MTDKKYIECKEKGIAIYKIWVKNGKFHKKKYSHNYFDESWIARSWINDTIPYDVDKGVNFIYATADKLDKCKAKLLKHLKDEQIATIKDAQKKLALLEKIQ